MAFIDNEEDKKEEQNDKDDDSKYYGNTDELKVVFKEENEIKKIVVEEDEEVIPQNNEEYQVQSQLIEEETEFLAPINVSQEMRKSFLEYAMSVIVSRALPDARDGLKPVHRRILYSMSELGVTSSDPFKKSARIVGDVLGKYHPHGDTAIYESMVRMAQDFSLRYPLIDGHGNFGSIDGDEAAAMRYTEARMSKIANEMIDGLKKNTVDFIPNYDGSELEPLVLPARFPNLLISGSVGIAVGMATNIPPHNLGEVIDGVIALARKPEITIEELMQYVKGPDFPTGAMILGRKGIVDAYTTGRGSIAVRSKTHIELLKNGKSRIIVTEIPYEVRKPLMIEKIANLVKEKKVEGIIDLRDETSRKGIRVVIELKKNVVPEVLLNQLFKLTNLQTNYSANMIALVNNEPKLLNLKEALDVYLQHQINVVSRRTQFDLEKAEARAHILEGLKIAISNIDEVIRIIRNSKTDAEAQEKMMTQFDLSDKQAKAITEMRLGRLTGLAIEKMNEELAELNNSITNFKQILSDRSKLIQLIIDELTIIRDKYSDERRTEIDINNFGDISDEDLIPEKNILITMSAKGYVKRIPLIEYKVQKRGGVGSSTQTTYSDDDVAKIISTTTHTDLLVFTSYGKVYRLRAHQIPEMSKQAKGIPFLNLIQIEKDERVVSLLATNSYNEDEYLVTVTKFGVIKRTPIVQYQRINRNGKIALSMREGDELIKAMKVKENDEIIIGASNGKVVRFSLDQVRPMSRTATGVTGMRFDENEKAKVIGASNTSEGNVVLSIGANGFGKKTELNEYRQTKRGAKGVKSINADKSGALIYVGLVNGNEDIMVVTNKGIAIRTSLETVADSSRSTKGVRVIQIKDNSKIQSVAVLDIEQIEKEVEQEITRTHELLLQTSDSSNNLSETKNIDKDTEAQE
ncbi:DNA gyrase subunit A [Mesomycoplasma moatsii]|uniref:DNA gyrase subunit A n=1 Tax=Mesomycoplasma moatsii TaxID=171287 RepID=UPI0003B413E3